MASIVTMVQTELAESGSGVFWPVQQVYDYINEVIIDMFPLALYPVGSATITFTQASDLVPLATTSLMWPRWIEDGTRQYWIIKHADLERYDRNWRNTTQERPTFFVLWDESHLRPYPPVDGSGPVGIPPSYVYTMYGPTWAGEISSTNTDVDPSVPPLLRMAIVMRAAARLFDYSRPDLAQAHDAEADEYEARYRTQWRNQQSDNIKRLLPSAGWGAGAQSGFTLGQAGSIRVAKRIDGNSSNPYR